jgi:hypothetical protein
MERNMDKNQIKLEAAKTMAVDVVTGESIKKKEKPKKEKEK